MLAWTICFGLTRGIGAGAKVAMPIANFTVICSNSPLEEKVVRDIKSYTAENRKNREIHANRFSSLRARRE
jgi:hypothetical protein